MVDFPELSWGHGAGGGTRTLMPSLAPDFESSASAISPLRQIFTILIYHDPVFFQGGVQAFHGKTKAVFQLAIGIHAAPRLLNLERTVHSFLPKGGSSQATPGSLNWMRCKSQARSSAGFSAFAETVRRIVAASSSSFRSRYGNAMVRSLNAVPKNRHREGAR